MRGVRRWVVPELSGNPGRVAPFSLLLLQNTPVDLLCEYRVYRFLEA